VSLGSCGHVTAFGRGYLVLNNSGSYFFEPLIVLIFGVELFGLDQCESVSSVVNFSNYLVLKSSGPCLFLNH
jgi:hypothetical protein